MTIKKEYIPPRVGSFVDQAKGWVKDLNISRSSSVMPTAKVLGLLTVGMAAGAALAYFLDPVSGADRRKALKEKGQDLSKKTSEAVQDTYHNAKEAIVSRIEQGTTSAQTASQSSADLH